VAFTWTGALDTNLAIVRHHTGDIVSTDPLLTDAQVNYELSQAGDDVIAATDKCFRRILASPTVARAIDRNGTGFSASRSQRFAHMKEAYEMFKEEYAAMVPGAEWSEHSISDANSIESDSDFRRPTFSIGMDDYD